MSILPLNQPSSPNPAHPHHEAAHVSELLHRLRLDWLLRHMPPRLVWSGYVLFNGFVSIALLALLSGFTGSPFVFPSLGPTAYLFFFTPMADSASPRNAILGHAVGLACGYAAYTLFGLSSLPHGVHHGLDWSPVLASSLALSLTAALMVLLRVSHPPAGATTLIVALGILARPRYLLIIELAVVLLTVQAFLLNRLAGLPFPLWHEHGRPRRFNRLTET
jgi:CBS domain-containing membrane protein